MATENLSPLHQALKMVATAIYRLRQKVGDPAQLETQEKTSLVAAINELKRQNGGSSVDESQFSELINQRLSAITNGASSAFDTLKEIEEHLTTGNTATSAILAEIATIKSNLTACREDITAIKAYIGFDSETDLETLINNTLQTGA